MNLAENLWKIKNSLENRTYKVSGYNKFMIFDPKEREIQALSYYDRIVQHVLCDEILTPFFDKRLIYDNCASRIGKGTHLARIIKSTEVHNCHIPLFVYRERIVFSLLFLLFLIWQSL